MVIIDDPNGSPMISEFYNSETLTVPVSQTNWDVRDNATTLFTDVSVAHRIYLKTNTDITIRFNSTSNDAIPLGVDKMFDDDSLLVRDIFITTTGTQASVYVYMRGAPQR